MKKKKKTLYIRRSRVNLKKKSARIPYKVQNFVQRIYIFFRRKINLSRRKSFIRFINKFESSNIKKTFNYIKYFGMNKNYKLSNFDYKSKTPSFLFKKFKKFKKFNKKSKKVKNNIYKKNKIKMSRKNLKDVTILKVKFVILFQRNMRSKFRKIRSKNIRFKEKLCLYFSYRHMMYLPVRGQRTKTNAKTRKDFCII